MAVIIPAAETIAQNYHFVLERIAHAAARTGRQPDAVRLVVVTKGQPIEAVRAAAAAGARCFGENYPEEGVKKLLAAGEGFGVEWHMIGHVQSRKAGLVSKHYAWLHSLDSVRLAARLERGCEEENRRLPVLLECNVSGEASKYGFPAWDIDLLEPLDEAVRQLLVFPHLEVRGLMAMAPFLPDQEQSRPYFRRLHRLRDRLAAKFPQADWSELSMGMSADFEAAILEGATMVRIGQAILGARPQINQ